MLDKLDSEFAFGREALDVRGYRQELLSSNIANADTPGYRARDVDFATSLAGVMKKDGVAPPQGVGASNMPTLAMTQPEGQAGMAAPSDGFMLVTTNAGHMSGKSVPSSRLADTYGQLQYRVPRQPSLDGNTVDPDTERVQFADNALHFESAMTEVSSGLKGLMSVITSGS